MLSLFEYDHASLLQINQVMSYSDHQNKYLSIARSRLTHCQGMSKGQKVVQHAADSLTNSPLHCCLVYPCRPPQTAAGGQVPSLLTLQLHSLFAQYLYENRENETAYPRKHHQNWRKKRMILTSCASKIRCKTHLRFCNCDLRQLISTIH